MFFGAIGVLAAALITQDSIGPTTHDYAACLESDDLPICVLRVSQTGRFVRPLSENVLFQNAPEIVALVEREAGEDETRGAYAPDGFERLMGEPERLRSLAVERARSLRADGASVEDALQPVRETAFGRPAAEFMLGQIYIDSGAEIRANAYRTLYLESREDDDEFARGAVLGWEAEWATGDINSYHNLSLGAGELMSAFLSLNDLEGALRIFPDADLGEAGIDPTIWALFVSEGVDAALAEAHAREIVSNSEYARLAATRNFLASHQVRQGGRTADESLRIYAEAAGNAQPLLPADFMSLLETAPTNAVRHAAEALEAESSRYDPTSAGLAMNTFDAWERLGEHDRADAIMTHWHQLARREAETPNNCGPWRSNCAMPAYYHMLARRNRIADAYEFAGFSIQQALRYELENDRGLENFDALVALEPQPAFPELALSQCATRADRFNSIDIGVARECLDRLDELGGHRQATERELLIATRPGLAIADYRYGPYRVASSAIWLGWAYALRDDAGEAEAMLRLALTRWRDNPEGQSSGVGWHIQVIAALLLVADGRMPESALPSVAVGPRSSNRP